MCETSLDLRNSTGKAFAITVLLIGKFTFPISVYEIVMKGTADELIFGKEYCSSDDNSTVKQNIISKINHVNNRRRMLQRKQRIGEQADGTRQGF